MVQINVYRVALLLVSLVFFGLAYGTYNYYPMENVSFVNKAVGLIGFFIIAAAIFVANMVVGFITLGDEDDRPPKNDWLTKSSSCAYLFLDAMQDRILKYQQSQKAVRAKFNVDEDAHVKEQVDIMVAIRQKIVSDREKRDYWIRLLERQAARIKDLKQKIAA